MGFRDIKPGKVIAKPVSAQFIQAKTGTLGLEVKFAFKQEGREETINWVAWLSEKAIERSTGILIDCLGWNGDDEVRPGTSILKPGSIDVSRDVELDIQMESYSDGTTGEQRSSPKVQWVNQPSTGSQFKELAPETVKGSIAALNLKAHFHAAKSGAVKPKSAQTDFAPDDSLPF